MTKPYAEQTVEERLASLDKIQNFLIHPDWRELYFRFSADAQDLQRQMDEAPNWDTFVAARAMKSYLTERLLNLRDLVAAEKADLEESQLAGDPLPPTDYEVE